MEAQPKRDNTLPIDPGFFWESRSAIRTGSHSTNLVGCLTPEAWPALHREPGPCQATVPLVTGSDHNGVVTRSHKGLACVQSTVSARKELSLLLQCWKGSHMGSRKVKKLS